MMNTFVFSFNLRRYRECRKGVYAPSDFDIALADRSTLEPDVELQLEFVYGYDGRAVHLSTCWLDVSLKGLITQETSDHHRLYHVTTLRRGLHTSTCWLDMRTVHGIRWVVEGFG